MTSVNQCADVLATFVVFSTIVLTALALALAVTVESVVGNRASTLGIGRNVIRLVKKPRSCRKSILSPYLTRSAVLGALVATILRLMMWVVFRSVLSVSARPAFVFQKNCSACNTPPPCLLVGVAS